MKKNAFNIFLSIIGLFTLVSCQENSLIPDGKDTLDNRNIEAWIFKYWNGSDFYFDSIYNVDGGQIQITEMKLVFSDYEFSLSNNDTINSDTSYGISNLKSISTKIGLLPVGSYTGEHQITVGYDSTTYFYTPLNQVPSELMADGILRNDQGFNHLLIRGKYREDTDTIFWFPTKPFEYQLGGMEFNLHFEKPMSFAVTANNPISIFFNFDIGMLFQNGITPPIISKISSDPNDNDDYTAATALYTNFDQALSLQ